MTLILAALTLGLCAIISSLMLVIQLQKIDKNNTAYNATKGCLIDLVNELNARFPGSSLFIQDRGDIVKVLGELKYLTKDERV